MAVSTEQRRGALLAKMAHSDGEVEALDDFPRWHLVGHRSGQIEAKSALATPGSWPYDDSNLTTIELVPEIADEPIATDRKKVARETELNQAAAGQASRPW
jgi:hypothetical protein